MKTITLGVIAAASMFAGAAQAAPLGAASLGLAAGATLSPSAEQVRLVCDQRGRCFRTRGPRYVQRYYGDDDVVVRRSYNSYDGPGYYGPGYGGPGVSFSFGSRGW